MTFSGLRKPETLLELGTTTASAAAYIAATREPLSHSPQWTRLPWCWQNPAPEGSPPFAGLRDRVSFERSYSTYTWFLKEQIEERHPTRFETVIRFFF